MAIAIAAPEPVTLPLGGEWRFDFDRENRGIGDRWFARELAGRAVLPGALPAQSLGDPVTVDTAWTGSLVDKAYYTSERFAEYRVPGNIKVPFWLQPETYYAGVAWFQRDIEIPAEWAGRRVVLFLERPHWATTVWLDDRELGSNDSLSTPHVYELGAAAPGRHRLSLRVDNGRVVDVGENSHSISDHTQGNWNGIVGRVELRSTAPVWIDDLTLYPEVAASHVRAVGQVRSLPGQPLPSSLTVAVRRGGAEDDAQPVSALTCAVDPNGRFAAELPLGANAPRWDEFQPGLHRVTATLPNGESRTATFGLREISTAGSQLLLNGRKIFIRATLECAIFPKTGHPPTDVASWRRILQTAREYGLNSIRFHSWCPPEAAFVAGDELGFYFQVEAASWPNQSTTLGDGKPVDAWLERETQRILAAYGNHPSFVLMAACNEPGGDAANHWLAGWLNRRRQTDPRRLYTSGSGWPQLPENQYHVTSDPRIQHWDEGLKSRINSRPPETVTDYRDYITARTVPVIAHEIGQWCAYPDFSEMSQYTGYLKPRNFEIFRTSLQRHGLGALAPAFLAASGKLQTLCYKEDIEAALRTPGMGGFQLLDLHDFPGQGTALVGVLNAFWGNKGYVSAPEYRRFCNRTVPLARLAKRVFTSDETLEADVEIAHFGPQPLERARSSWRLVSADGREVATGRFEPRDIPVGNGTRLGHVHVALASLPVPARYTLVARLDDTAFENDWDVWVYPAKPAPAPAGVLVTSELDAAVAALAAGGNVLLSIPPEHVRNDGPDPVALGFSSIFWNTSWTGRQPPTTLGLLCEPRHPALAAFPTESHSNWQWWYVVTYAAPLRLDGLPRGIEPIVRVIDDWQTNRSLGLLFEARVGKGKLLVTSVALADGELDPVRRQLRSSLLAYAAGAKFRPATALTIDELKTLLVP